MIVQKLYGIALSPEQVDSWSTWVFGISCVLSSLLIVFSIVELRIERGKAHKRWAALSLRCAIALSALLLLVGNVQYRLSGMSQTYSNAAIAEANAIADDAGCNAAESFRLGASAIRVADSLRVRADSLEKQLVGLKIELFQLEANGKDRLITPSQERELIRSLKDAPKCTVRIDPKWSSDEARRFGAMLRVVFEHAGYRIEASPADEKMTDFLVAGQFMYVHSRLNNVPALRVQLAFEKIGFWFPALEVSSLPDSVIVIGVSTKSRIPLTRKNDGTGPTWGAIDFPVSYP